MRHYSLKMFGAAILLLAMTAVGWKTLDAGLYVSATLAFLFDVGLIVFIYRLQINLMGTLKYLISCTRYNDTEHMPLPAYRNRLVQELATELSDTFEALKLRISEENTRLKYYEQLLNQVNLPVVVTDRQANIEWRNRAATKAFGNDAKLPEAWLAAPDKRTKAVRLTRHGQTIEMAMTADTFTVGTRDLWLLSFKDIGDMLEQNELEAQQKLIRVLTHEVMNSLSPILSLTETMTEYCDAQTADTAEADTMRQALQTIHRRSEGLMQFVENYRRLTRLPTPIVAPVQVDDLLADLKQLFPAAYVRFHASPRGATVMADRSQLEQALINLMKNACEAVEGKPEAKVQLTFQRLAGDSDHFYVEDNGPGLRPEVAEQVFVPFFTTKPGGSGIGLSLCKQIARLHGGNIRLQSSEGIGTRVDFLLPPSPKTH